MFIWYIDLDKIDFYGTMGSLKYNKGISVGIKGR